MPAANEWLLGALANSMGSAFAALTGIRIEVTPSTENAPEDLSGAFVWKQQLDVAPEAAIWVAAGPKSWRRLGQLVLASAGLDEAADAETRATFLEALQQALSAFPAVLGQRLGREVLLSAGEETEYTPGSNWLSLKIAYENGEEGWLLVDFGAALAEALGGDVAAPEAEPPTIEDAATGPLTASRLAPRGLGAAENSRTLDLLLEVELPVGVSFGRTQMKVKDAIKLTTGSIVELNRNVSAPIEVVVNNCVIARGEVVVVEGNYGVRIQEIVSREERLRTLF